MDLNKFKQHYDTEKVLVMGLPKAGKTQLVAELSSKFKLHWIDIDHGIKTLMQLTPEQQANINLIALPDSGSYPIAAETLLLLFKANKAKICHEHGKVNCAECAKNNPEGFDLIDLNTLGKNDILVLDSATQLGMSILAHIVRKETVDYKPDRDDWGALKKYTEFFKSQFQALPCNFVCIAHVVEAKDEEGKTKLFPAFGSANMSTMFGGAFDHVVYIEQKNLKHVAGSMTNYSMQASCGSRTNFDITKTSPMSLLPLFDGTHIAKKVGPSPAQTAMTNLAAMAGKKP